MDLHLCLLIDTMLRAACDDGQLHGSEMVCGTVCLTACFTAYLLHSLLLSLTDILFVFDCVWQGQQVGVFTGCSTSEFAESLPAYFVARTVANALKVNPHCNHRCNCHCHCLG